jgi:acyl-CoA synthetase (AMP-forming)/AMP-acid ligase II
MATNSPNFIANSLISCRLNIPNNDYVIFGERRITWAQMMSRVFKLSQALINLGVKRGDKVAFMFHNTPEFFEVNHAIQVAGAVPTPMNYRYVASEVAFQGKQSDSKVLIYDDIWAESVEAAIPDMPNIKHLICRGKSESPDVVDYEEFLATGRNEDPAVANDPDDLAVMIYTGGTTGFPKGVMLTYQAHVEMYAIFTASYLIRTLTMDVPKERHKLMIDLLPLPAKRLLGPLYRTNSFKKLLKRESTEAVLRKMFYKRFTDPDQAKKGYKNKMINMYPSMPFFHDASYSNLLLGELVGYITYVLPDSVSFEPKKILELAEREQVTNISNVPTGWRKLLAYPEFDKYNLDAVRLVTTGGGPSSINLKKQIISKIPTATLLDVFGQAEMTPITSFRIDVDTEKVTDRSVGKSIVEVKVVDDQGNEVPAGESGELCYRSNTMMKGYYKDEEKTEEVMEGGWFRSGDLGYLDENGEIRTIDRKKECINTGGEKVYPVEVEDIIQAHPEIDFACVIGVPSEEWGSSVRAVVQLAEGSQLKESAIIEFCRGKLASYKIPRSFIFVEALPFSPVGKLLRQKVRDNHGLGV